MFSADLHLVMYMRCGCLKSSYCIHIVVFHVWASARLHSAVSFRAGVRYVSDWIEVYVDGVRCFGYIERVVRKLR